MTAIETANLSKSGIPLPLRAKKSFCHQAASRLGRESLSLSTERRSSRVIDFLQILDAWVEVGLAVGAARVSARLAMHWRVPVLRARLATQSGLAFLTLPRQAAADQQTDSSPVTRSR